MNILMNAIEKISQIEPIGIFIEDIQIRDRYKLMDDNLSTLTGVLRPAGEYYSIDISVLVAVDQPSDETEILKTQLKEYPEVQETFAVCKKATKSEYLEDYIPKKAVKKAVKK